MKFYTWRPCLLGFYEMWWYDYQEWNESVTDFPHQIYTIPYRKMLVKWIPDLDPCRGLFPWLIRRQSTTFTMVWVRGLAHKTTSRNYLTYTNICIYHFIGLVHEIRNSSALAMELCHRFAVAVARFTCLGQLSNTLLIPWNQLLGTLLTERKHCCWQWS